MPGRVVMVGAENGELSLSPANQVRVFGASRKIEIIKIKTSADLQAAYDIILRSPFDSVHVDSLSEIAERVLAGQLATCTDPRKAYGNMQEIMAKYIRLFRDLPNKHVCMTAKMDREADINGAVLFGPMMPGKTMTQAVGHFFDEVFAMHLTGADPAGKTWRVLRCQPNTQYSAKDRSGCLNELEAPNLSAIIAKITKQ